MRTGTKKIPLEPHIIELAEKHVDFVQVKFVKFGCLELGYLGMVSQGLLEHIYKFGVGQVIRF